MNLELFATFCRTVSNVLGIPYRTPISASTDLLQVLSVLAMERPVSFAAEDIRDEKVTTPVSHIS